MACSTVCAVLVVAIVLGVVVYLSLKALKGCEKLKKTLDRNHPDDDGDGVTPVTPPATNAPSNSFVPLQHNATAMDISDLAYTDPNGNVYCIASDTFIEATSDLSQPFQNVAKIETYVSFASASAMQWDNTYQCYPQIMTGAAQPQGVRTKYFDPEGVLVGSQYQSFNAGNAQCSCVTISTQRQATTMLRARSPVT